MSRNKRIGNYPYHLNGYIVIAKGRDGKNILEHQIVAARALGRPVTLPEEIHHRNEQKDDNRSENLVICPTREYHMLLHYRLTAFRATGDPAKMKCIRCLHWDDIKNLRREDRVDIPGRRYRYVHRRCANARRSHQLRRHVVATLA